LLGFRFAPRIRNLGDTRLYSMEKPSSYAARSPLIGGIAKKKQITGHWDEILRLATSIKHGSVTASLMLRKLGAYPRQNGLAVALRELGKIEQTLFLLQYISSVELRRRIHVGLNKGEAKNALARAVFFNRRYERKPVIITTNRPFKEWNQVFPNATCIVTLLDRLLHHADVTVVEGDSYRKRESEQETAERRRKK
jgi:hypothetical protein